MADIEIGDIEPLNGYTAAGGETGYAYSFPIFASDDLIFQQITTAGVVTTLSLGVDYTLSGVGDATGGTATFDTGVYPTGAIAGYRYVLFRDLAVSRTTDFLAGGDFKATVMNKELDSIIMMIQQNELSLKRSLSLEKYDVEDEIKFANETAAARTDKFLRFGSSGNTVEAGPTASDIENAGGYAAAAAASATDADTSATEAAASAAGVNLPAIGAGDAKKLLQVNDAETGHELVAFASQAQAEAGTDDDAPMNSLRTSQAIAAQAQLPVGSVYINYSVATNPGTLLGYGTWVAVEDVVLLGASGTYAAGSTGGAATATIAEANLPSSLGVTVGRGNSGDGDGSGDFFRMSTNDNLGTSTATLSSVGSGTALDILPPYVAVYMWRRTA